MIDQGRVLIPSCESKVDFGNASPSNNASVNKLTNRPPCLKDKLMRKINQNMQFLEDSDGLDQTCANQGIDLIYFAPNDPDSRPNAPADSIPRRTFSKFLRAPY